VGARPVGGRVRSWVYRNGNVCATCGAAEHAGQRAGAAELDSDKHIAVTVHGGLLTITAERQAQETSGRSEFSYGTFSRTTALPAGTDSSAMTANYTDGVLEVSMPHAEHPSDTHVTIQVAKAVSGHRWVCPCRGVSTVVKRRENTMTVAAQTRVLLTDGALAMVAQAAPGRRRARRYSPCTTA
jgi:hypothetical protein